MIPSILRAAPTCSDPQRPITRDLLLALAALNWWGSFWLALPPRPLVWPRAALSTYLPWPSTQSDSLPRHWPTLPAHI
eukprot:1852113-Rhodomonas_salina.1